MLSIIIPTCNEEQNVKIIAKEIRGVLGSENIEYELRFVDDGSTDKTLEEIRSLSEVNPNVHYISFSRNFGKESAIFAGLKYAIGDCVAVMDSDLQHPVEALIRMYRLWESGYEVIEGKKKMRQREGLIHKVGANVFYKILSKMMDIDLSNSSDFKLMDRKVVNALNELTEYHTFFRSLSFWVGFKSVALEYEVNDRKYGSTKWSRRGLMKYALDNMIEFSSAPMHVVTITGIVFLVFSIVLGVQTLVRYFSGQAVEGFTTVILLLLIIGGVLMAALGIIGCYIAKIYDETKRRPRYIIQDMR